MSVRVPAGRYGLVNVAPVPMSVTVPMDEAPFLKVIVPVGRTGPIEATVAVSVTGCP